MRYPLLCAGLALISLVARGEEPPPVSAPPATPPAQVQHFRLPPIESPSVEAAIGSHPVRVERIVFRGNKALRTAALEAVARPFAGRELTAADIEELRVELSRAYTDRGYINSGVVLDPDAPYQNGVLRFLAIEGKLTKVRVHGNGHLQASYVVDRLAGDPDETLNVNVLRERFQRLLDDPLFTRVNSRIEPGYQLGEAILDVDIERARPYSLALAFNDYRPPSIGEKAYDLNGQVRDLTGVGDLLDMDVNGALEHSGGIGYGFDWQVPINHHGTQIAVSASKAQTVITEEPLAALDVRSTIERYELRFIQSLFASLHQQFNVGLGVAREKNWTSLAGEEFSFLPGAANGTTRSTTIRFVPDYSLRLDRQFLEIRVTVLHATLLDYPTMPVSYSLPAHEYYVTTAQAHHLLELAPLPLELESRVTVQRTDAIVSDIHALEIGGINSVRGFEEDEVLASNVDNLNVDFRWLALSANSSWRPSLTVGTFFDWAQARDAGTPWQTFSSCGGTVRAKWKHVQADLAGGVRLVRPEFVNQQHGNLQDHGILFQLLMYL